MIKLRKIYLGIITCAFLLTSLVTTTYAWFQLNAESTVDAFEVDITSQEGLLLSINGNTYAKKLTVNDIKKAIVAKYLGTEVNDFGEVYSTLLEGMSGYDSSVPLKKVLLSSTQINEYYSKIQLAELTSSDGKTFGDVYNGYEIVETPPDDVPGPYQENTYAVTSGKYVSFDLYFKVETTGKDNRVENEKSIGLYFLTADATSDPNGDPNYLINKAGTSIYSDAITVSLLNNLYKRNAENTMFGAFQNQFVANVNYDATAEITETNSPYQHNSSTLNVNPANALRFSTTVSSVNQFVRDADSKAYTSTVETASNVTKIYELSANGTTGEGDSAKAYTDLGSYATDIDVTNAIYDSKYDAAISAAYTYANYLDGNGAAFATYQAALTAANALTDTSAKNTALTDARTDLWDALRIKPMKYNALWFEKHINYFDSLKKDNKVSLEYGSGDNITSKDVYCEDEEASMVSLFTKDSNYETKVTFNIWLEGRDSDAILGWKNNAKMTVKLSFTIDPQAQSSELDPKN